MHLAQQTQPLGSYFSISVADCIYAAHSSKASRTPPLASEHTKFHMLGTVSSKSINSAKHPNSLVPPTYLARSCLSKVRPHTLCALREHTQPFQLSGEGGRQLYIPRCSERRPSRSRHAPGSNSQHLFSAVCSTKSVARALCLSPHSYVSLLVLVLVLLCPTQPDLPNPENDHHQKGVFILRAAPSATG